MPRFKAIRVLMLQETTHPGAPPGTIPPVEPKCNCGIGGGKDDPGHNDQGTGCEASNHSHPLTKPDQVNITSFNAVLRRRPKN